MSTRETLIDFATWLSEQVEIDVATPDEAVDLFLGRAVPPPPAFKVVFDIDGDAHTECPHCGELGTIVEVDNAIRFNELVFDGDDHMRPRASMGPEGDWDFDHWFCESCATSDLQAPVGLDIRDWS